MHKQRALWLNITVVLVLLLVSIVGSGASRVSAVEVHHSNQEQSLMSSSNSRCESQCSSTASMLPAHAKRDEEEQDEEPEPAETPFLRINPFRLVLIQKITSVIDIARQLRPPDIFALNCSYNF